MAEANQRVFATEEVTVHKLLSADPQKDPQSGEEIYHTESVVLLPGQHIPADEVPPYLLEKIEAGTLSSLSLMSQNDAEELSAKAAEIRGIAAGEGVNVQGVPSESDANRESLKLAQEAVGRKSKRASKESE